MGNDRKSAIISARVQSQSSEMKSMELHYLARCVALRFENLLTSSRYFFELKDLSLDGLSMQAECLTKKLPKPALLA